MRATPLMHHISRHRPRGLAMTIALLSLCIACADRAPVAEERDDGGLLDDFDTTHTDGVEDGISDAEDELQPPSCESLFALDATPDFELVEVIGGERNRWRLLWPRLDLGCVSYVPEIEVLESSDGDVSTSVWARYRLHLCHTCESTMAIHWWTLVDGGEREPIRSFADLNLTVQLRDASGTLLPALCPTGRRFLCPYGEHRETPPERAWFAITPGEHVTLDNMESGSPHGGTAGFSLQNFFDGMHSGGNGESPLPDEPPYRYWDDPLDYSSPLALEAQLPRLWPVDTPHEAIPAELPADIACQLAGLTYDDRCYDRTVHVPWSPDDLLVHPFEDIHRSAHFPGWLERVTP